MAKSNFEVYYLLGCLALKLAHHLGNYRPPNLFSILFRHFQVIFTK